MSDLLDSQTNRLHLRAFAGEQAKTAFGLGLVAQIGCFALESIQLRDSPLKFFDAVIPLAAPWARRNCHGDILAMLSKNITGLPPRS